MGSGTILYVGGFELPDKNAAAHRVVSNAKIFQALGYQVVFCGIDKSLKWGSTPVINEYPFGVSRPMPYPNNIRQWFLRLTDISHYLRVMFDYSDLKFIIAYNLQASLLNSLRRLGKKHDIKVIADCTEWYDYRISLNPVTMVKAIDTMRSMCFIHKRLDGLFLISTYLCDYYGSSVPYLLLPPLIDKEEEKWHAVHPASESDIIRFVYSGQPGTSKDKIGQVIRCFGKLEQYTDYRFDVIGISREQFQKTYPYMGKTLDKLSGRIVLHGRVSHADSIRSLQAADYCIFIRDQTRKNMAGFPTKFVESYTSGIHIIASDVSNIRDYFPEDPCSALLTENSDEAICNVIEKVFERGLTKSRAARREGLHDNPFDYREWTQDVDAFLKLVRKENEHPVKTKQKKEIGMFDSKPKILLTFRAGGENGGPYISHQRIMHSSLMDYYEFKPLMVPRARKLLTFKGMKIFIDTIRKENPMAVQLSGLQLEGFLLMFACKRARVKTVLAVHGSSTEACGFGAFARSIFRAIEKYTVRHADLVYGVSDYVSGWPVCKSARRYYGTIYNMPPKPGDTDHICSLHDELKLSVDDVVVVSIGRITKDKGYDVFWQMIQTIGHTEHIKYVIAGEGAYKDEWQEEIRKNHYDNEVFLLGYRQDIDRVLKTGNIFLICTRHETLCISLLEAAMFRLPLVATDVGGIPEIVNSGENGWLVENENAPAFAERILQLASDEKLRLAFGARSYELVSAKFNTEKITTQVDELYKEVIGG